MLIWPVVSNHMYTACVTDSKNTYRKYKTSDIERDVENRHEQVGDCQIDDEDICDWSHATPLQHHVTNH